MTPLDRDRALVKAMRLLGESTEVIDDFLACLDISEADRAELRELARHGDAAAMATGDVIEMNPLTSQPQRSRPRA
jgi:cell division inhibitor SulA